MEEQLFLGVGRRTITPKVGTHLTGYRPGLVSTSVNDDLTATAFYFKQGDTCALIVCVTLCGVSLEITNEIFQYALKKHNIPRSAAIMNSIHTHSGPNLIGGEGFGDTDTEYRYGIFLPQTVAAIDEAVANARPVQMAIATGESLIGVNRRELTADNKIQLGQNPWGPFDPQMTILSFKDEADVPVANIIHYGAHATASGANSEISRDWPGVMTDILEAETGAVTAFISGPEGDVGPRLSNGETTGNADIRYAMRHGAWAGQDAVRIYKTGMGNYHTPKLFAYGGTLDIPLAPRISYEEAKAGYEKYKEFTVNWRAKLKQYYADVIASYEKGYEDQANRAFEQNIIRLGDVAIVSFSFELFSEIALRIRKYSKIPHVLSLALTNGVGGYFATETELCRGGYEITMANINYIQGYTPDADWHIVKNTLKNLEHTEE